MPHPLTYSPSTILINGMLPYCHDMFVNIIIVQEPCASGSLTVWVWNMTLLSYRCVSISWVNCRSFILLNLQIWSQEFISEIMGHYLQNWLLHQLHRALEKHLKGGATMLRMCQSSSSAPVFVLYPSYSIHPYIIQTWRQLHKNCWCYNFHAHFASIDII